MSIYNPLPYLRNWRRVSDFKIRSFVELLSSLFLSCAEKNNVKQTALFSFEHVCLRLRFHSGLLAVSSYSGSLAVSFPTGLLAVSFKIIG